ncbi:MAG: hypothetical protein LUH15_07670 [Tannerellaceae bacterium]|nr:hypothetical protein [Tannerellaceae bacterium]
MKYLIVDRYPQGTGIRDKYEGKQIELKTLPISSELFVKFTLWLEKYQKEFYDGYSNTTEVEKLDIEGENIAILLKRELIN